MGRFPFYEQPDLKDCGPACLKMIAQYYGWAISISSLRNYCETTRQGSSLLNLAQAAERLGFRTMGVQVTLHQLTREVPLPCVIHWDQNHYVVLYRIHKRKVYIADPAIGKISYSHDEFLKHWIGKERKNPEAKGVALILEPTAKRKSNPSEKPNSSIGFRFLIPYVLRYKKFIVQLLIGLVATALLELLFPFLTQSIIDVGIRNRDISFIYMILGAQLFLFLGKTSIEIIRSWILLHISTRLNISLISDFFVKLMSLPIAYFDVKMTGDLLQRINDHSRIENLMTNSSLSVLFSLFSLGILGSVLAFYDIRIFGIFVLGSLAYIGWISLFLSKRRKLDYQQFEKLGEEQSKVIELLGGMQEIKLQNAERQQRWKWEALQVELFKLSVKSLSLEQYQSVGAGFINEIKNIFITIFSALLVVQGELTLGMLLAISYITGQLNSPINRLVSFVYTYQDARIALERLSEIHGQEEEEAGSPKIRELPLISYLQLKNVSFRYPGMREDVLSNINLHIPMYQVTAIVGASGSGKTTLLKMLLKYYPPKDGSIWLGLTPLTDIAQESWRASCGVVLQEGYLFNDTITNNICIGSDHVDTARLLEATETANIRDFIESLPLRFNTKIGKEGMGLSSGQKQRILIARAIYKNPSHLFFDEATSALDANNEKTIVENLHKFTHGRTAVVVAHRLSTVKNADQIIVMDKGRIAEQGTHTELVNKRAYYYRLIKNQLELHAHEE